jgi:hypothetical protein
VTKYERKHGIFRKGSSIVIDLSIGQIETSLYRDLSALQQRLVAFPKGFAERFLIQGIHCDVSTQVHKTIFPYITDLNFRLVHGEKYLEYLVSTYGDYYDQSRRPYPDPEIEEIGFVETIFAAVEFGFTSRRNGENAVHWAKWYGLEAVIPLLEDVCK